MPLKIMLIALLFCIELSAQTGSFIGKPGIYVLGRLSSPMQVDEYSKPFVAGTAVRITWDSLETSPGIYNWSFTDSEIANAKAYNKKISLLIVGYPHWLPSVGVPMYEYVDNYPLSRTYLDTLQAPVTWSKQYVNRLSMLIKKLAVKYASDTNVSYINCGAGNMNNNLPNRVASGEDFWTATDYNPDTLVDRMKQILDVYMSVFPNTPAWNSLENIWFEPQATGNTPNYVITGFAEYGVNTYPDRFGAWREDLTGCQNTTESNSQWYTMATMPCRTGAQMTLNVQDGPTRMNNCGLVPNTKEFVLQAAFNKGFSMNMRYFEVYKEDIDDASLSATIQDASDSTLAIYNQCLPLKLFTAVSDLSNDIKLYPNPVEEFLNIEWKDRNFSVEIMNLSGHIIYSASSKNSSASIDCSRFAGGVYYIRLSDDMNTITRRLVRQ